LALRERNFKWAGTETRPYLLKISDNCQIFLLESRGDSPWSPFKSLKLELFGRNGEGPEEIKDQRAAFLLGDRIVISESGKINYFTSGGNHIKSVKNNYFIRTPVIFINEDEFISVPYSTSHIPGGKGKISKINLNSGKETIINEFPIFKGGIARLGDGAQIVYIISELAPLMNIAYDSNRLYYGMSNSYKITVADLNGNIFFNFSLKRKKKKISPRAKEDLFPKSGPVDATKALINSYSNELTYFTSIEIHNNYIYVFLSDLEHPYQKEIDIFSLDGKYQYRSCIRFAKKYAIPSISHGNAILIKNDNLYIVLEGEEGEIIIARYKIKVPIVPVAPMK
jgi:hypothetical protein